ncbi:MAG: hypothetical protein ACJA1A_002614 [Saprospiraceae bacterium]|jgi:hypothetical protein|tara:strand:- start:352 stop:876 length:525 start_codon:yes stop_codon:yes gene_type:complete
MNYKTIVGLLFIIGAVSCTDENQKDVKKDLVQQKYYNDTVYVPLYLKDNNGTVSELQSTLYVRSISTNDTILIHSISTRDEKNNLIEEVTSKEVLLPMHSLDYQIESDGPSSHILVSYKIRNDRKPVIENIVYDEEDENRINLVSRGIVLSRKKNNWSLGLSNYGKNKSNKSQK